MNAFSSRGFNLLELMVGIAVLGLLLAIGVPSFTEIIARNRAASQTNDVVSALSYARSEAVKRGIRVSVCPGSNGACSGASDWNVGVLVFTDDTGTAGALDGTDAALQAWSPFDAGLTATGPSSVSFVATGAQTAATIDMFKSGCTGQNKRRVKVELTGRVGFTKESC